MQDLKWTNDTIIHLQSEHSLGRGSMTVRELFQRASQMNIKRVIITEFQSMASCMEAYDCMQEFGITACVGVEAKFCCPTNRMKAEGTLLLLPKDLIGQRIISRALSDSYKEDGSIGFDRALLEQWFGPQSEGHGHVMATTGGAEGILVQLLEDSIQTQKDLETVQSRKRKLDELETDEGRSAVESRKHLKERRALAIQEKQLKRKISSIGQIQVNAARLCTELARIFGHENFYVEMVCHQDAMEKEILLLLAEAVGEFQLLIADEAKYADCTKEERRRQFLIKKLAAADGQEGEQTGTYHMRSFETVIHSLQKILAPEIIQRGIEGRIRCCNACIPISFSDENHYPVFPGENGDVRLRRLVEAGIQRCFPWKKEWNRQYEERLRDELEVISKTGFADYFCIVEDLVRYVKELERQARTGAYYVGPGRGSAAGSLVCYLLGITTIDPIKDDLLFSRFLNINRITAPDIDIDIAPQIYEKVIDYAKKKYGVEAISAISTKMRMGALQALELAAGVHKASPQLLQTMKDCLSDIAEGGLRDSEQLKRFAQKNKKSAIIMADAVLLEGRRIGTGQHPSGLVLADVTDIRERTPVLFNARTGNWMTQLDMTEVERSGLLKIDLLKLRTLDVISETIAQMKKPLHPDRLTVETEVFKELAIGHSVGVFQLESAGMRNLLCKLRPESLEDLTLLISIYRPGPMQYADQIVQTKNRQGIRQWNSKKLNAILHSSYGYPVYQEQLMQIFHEIGGISLSETDFVRKAIAKKNGKALEPYQNRLLEGLVQDGMTSSQANGFWKELLEFGRYAFNRSHAAAYARLAYITAYLKYHDPAAYLCALLNHSDKNRIPVLIAECRKYHIDVLPPDICKSESRFVLYGPKTLRFGLSGIKGLGSAPIEKIMVARKERPLVSMKDFLERAFEDNRSTDLMVQAGVFDCWAINRSQLLTWYPKANQYLGAYRKEQQKDRNPQLAKLYRQRFLQSVLPAAQPDPLKKILAYEKQVLGCCLSKSPMHAYQAVLRQNKTWKSISDVLPGANILIGTVENLKVIHRKKDGKEFCIFTLQDDAAELEAVCFADVYERMKENIGEHKVIKAVGALKEEQGRQKFIIQDVESLEPVYEPVTISVPSITAWKGLRPILKQYIEPEGSKLLIQDRTSGDIYQAPFRVGSLQALEWNQEFYLLETETTGGAIDVAAKAEKVSKAA